MTVRFETIRLFSIRYTVCIRSIHIPGRWTLPNGDPGYPDEDHEEIVDIDSNNGKDIDPITWNLIKDKWERNQ